MRSRRECELTSARRRGSLLQRRKENTLVALVLSIRITGMKYMKNGNPEKLPLWPR